MDYFPAVRDPGSIDLLLNFIRQNTQPPPQVDISYLRGAGFRRDGDDALVDLLVFLGFLDPDSRPTQAWKALSTDSSGRILAEAVRRSYARLYDVFPDPEARESDELMPFFRKVTGAPDTDLAFMILTFRVLRDIAGPAPAPALPPSPARQAQAPAARPSATPQATRPPSAPRPAPQAGHAASAPDRPASVSIERAGDTRLRITIEVDGTGDAEMTSLVKALLAKALKA